MKMPVHIDENMIAPCGVNCLICSGYLDRKNPCPGCRAPEETISRKSCLNCAKKRCAFEQGLRCCFECGRFPCSKIKNFSKRYTQNYGVDLVQNGIDAKRDMLGHLAKQKDCFTCQFCGGIIDVHHRKCSECGKDFNGGE